MQSGVGGLNAGTPDSIMTDMTAAADNAAANAADAAADMSNAVNNAAADASNAVNNAAADASNAVNNAAANTDSGFGGGLRLATETPVQPEQPTQPQAQPNAGGFSIQPQQPVYGAQPGMNGQPGYGAQPGMNGQPGFGGQQIYGGPSQGMGGGVTPPKKSKKGLIIGLSIAAVVAAIACFCIFLLPKLLNPKKKVEAALKETLKNGVSITALEDQTGASDVTKKILESGGTIASQIKFESLGGTAMDAGVDVSLVRDNSAKKLSGDLGINYGGESLLSANICADDSKIYVAVPELVDGVFVLPTQNILQALANSPLAESLNVDLSALSALPQINIDLYQPITLGDASDVIFESGLWDKAQFKSKGSKSISVNGTDVKAKLYEVTFAEKDIEELVSNAIDTVSGSLSSNPAVSSMLGANGTQMSQVISQLKGMVPSIIGGDIVLNVYVKDGQAVKIETKGSWNLFGAAIDYNLFMDDMDNHTFVSATIGVAGQNITLTCDLVGGTDSMNGKINLGAAGASVDGSFDIKHSGNNLEGTFSVGAGGETIDAAFKGELKDTAKGEKYTVDFSEFTVTVQGQEVIRFSGSVTMDATNKNVKTVDASAKQYDITSMSQEDFQSVMTDNKDRIKDWSDRVKGLFGGIGSMVDPDGTEWIEDASDELDEEGEPGEEGAEEIDPEDLNEEITPEEMVVGSEDGKVTVQINGPGEGWECFYAGGMVSFQDADYNDINYTFETGDVKKILDERVLFDGEEASEFEDSKVDSYLEKEIDGKKVTYSVGTYKAKPDSSFGDTTITILAAVVEVGDGQYLMASTTTWSEDGLKIDDILNALKSSCYTVK